jgi:hypothetical protein
MMTRKQFVAAGLRTAGAAFTVMLVGCPDDDDDVVDVDDTGTTVTPTTETTGAPTTATAATETTMDGTTQPTDATQTTGETTTSDDTAGATETVGIPVCDEVDTVVGPPSVGPEHDHVVGVPAADVMAGREMTYMLSMDLGHVHEITVTADMFALLAQGQEIMTDTLVDATMHAHTVTLVCG